MDTKLIKEPHLFIDEIYSNRVLFGIQIVEGEKLEPFQWHTHTHTLTTSAPYLGTVKGYQYRHISELWFFKDSNLFRIRNLCLRIWIGPYMSEHRKKTKWFFIICEKSYIFKFFLCFMTHEKIVGKKLKIIMVFYYRKHNTVWLYFINRYRYNIWCAV